MFRDVVEVVSANKTLFGVLQSTSLPRGIKKAFEDEGVKASMSSVNKALKDKTFQRAAWEALEIDIEVPFPTLYSDTIYGDLSASIHSPALSEVFVSSQSTTGDRAFFGTIAARFIPPKAVLIFDESFAVLGSQFPPFLEL